MTTPIVHVIDDDEAGIRQATARLLSAAGFTVRTYRNGDDFLADNRAGSAGCIILDVRMPGRTGLDLQAAIAQHDDPLPIIFQTGFGTIPDSVRAIQGGAVDFLVKPVEPTASCSRWSRVPWRATPRIGGRAHTGAPSASATTG